SQSRAIRRSKQFHSAWMLARIVCEEGSQLPKNGSAESRVMVPRPSSWADARLIHGARRAIGLLSAATPDAAAAPLRRVRRLNEVLMSEADVCAGLRDRVSVIPCPPGRHAPKYVH